MNLNRGQNGNFDIPKKLLEAARFHRVIPFVGAGLSQNADPDRFPGWSELLRRMIEEFERAGYLPQERVRSLKQMAVEFKQAPVVAETIRLSVPKDAYLSFLQDQFSFVPHRPSSAHLHLFRLRPPIIITTNYDRLIENAFAHQSRHVLSVATYNQPGQIRNKLLDASRLKQPFLFKLHGDIEDPSNVILTQSDYSRLTSIKEYANGYRLLLSSLFFHYTTLFIGFSLTDEEVMLHIENVQEALSGERYPDYALFSRQSCTDDQAVKFRDKFGIHVIRYDRKASRHTRLGQFLSQLADCVEG